MRPLKVKKKDILDLTTKCQYHNFYLKEKNLTLEFI